MSDRIVILGANGMLGRALVKALSKDFKVLAFTRKQLDISNVEDVQYLDDLSFDILINCAAYTKVDLAETERELAIKTNTLGPYLLSLFCKKIGSKLITFSTDYVFDGKLKRGYIENDIVNPLNFYGLTKYKGEKAVLTSGGNNLIIRTSALFDHKSCCFPETIINAYNDQKHLRVVDNQLTCPTYAPHLAAQVCKILQDPDEYNGIYHCAGPEALSWYEFAERLFTFYTTKQVEIEPVPTHKYNTPAKRPLNSVLDTTKLDNKIGNLPSLDKAITEYMEKVYEHRMG